MASVLVDPAIVGACRAFAADIAQYFIDRHTTVGAERTVARGLAGRWVFTIDEIDLM